MYDYSLLEGRITTVCQSRGNFAKKMGLSERSVSLKMNQKVPWKQTEISRCCEILKIADKDIPIYFFDLKVQ